MTLESAVGRRVHFDGRDFLFFGGNDYLGLAGDVRLADAATIYAHRFGVNVSGSRRTTGTLAGYTQLEEQAAGFFKSEDALVFSSGFLSGAILQHVVSDDTWTIFADAELHPALRVLCDVAPQRVVKFQHHDAEDFQRQLACLPHSKAILVLVDGVDPFGSVAPLARFATALEQHRSMLIVDEAHAAGVIGPEGRGSAAAFGLDSAQTLQVGTFSKAFGAFGGFLCGSRKLCGDVRTYSAAYGGSTPLPPPLIGAALCSLEILRNEGDERRRHLKHLVESAARRIGEFCIGPSGVKFPVFAPDEWTGETAQHIHNELKRRGIYVPLIQYPTARAAARLRFVLSASHQEGDIIQLADALRQVL